MNEKKNEIIFKKLSESVSLICNLKNPDYNFFIKTVYTERKHIYVKDNLQLFFRIFAKINSKKISLNESIACCSYKAFGDEIPNN